MLKRKVGYRYYSFERFVGVVVFFVVVGSIRVGWIVVVVVESIEIGIRIRFRRIVLIEEFICVEDIGG